MMKSILAAAAIAFTWSYAALGQSAAQRPAFEVASVKPAPPPSGMGLRVMMGGDAGRINYENVSIRDVMRQAYQVKDFQIAGPDWMQSARYNIVAKIPPDTPREQVRLTLETLLAERFQLTFHRETKELPVYALVVGKNGPKVKASEVQQEGKGGGGKMMMRAGGELEAKQMSMSGLAELLARQVGRPVIDATELKGTYDFNLKYTPDEGQRMNMMAGMPAPMPAPDGGGERRAPPARENGPSLFAAVQEQLGLKLEARKGPVEILVVDRAERVPTEN